MPYHGLADGVARPRHDMRANTFEVRVDRLGPSAS